MSANESSASPSTPQAIIAASPCTHLRLVPPAPAPRLAVRINIFNGRSPFGRTRVFRLAERDIDELIAITQRMEWRP